jgi:hypothetical protein
MRSIEEALDIAESHGVYIPDDVTFKPISDQWLDARKREVLMLSMVTMKTYC